MSLNPAYQPSGGADVLLEAVQTHTAAIDGLNHDGHTTPERQLLAIVLELHAPVLPPLPPWWSRRVPPALRLVCRGCGRPTAPADHLLHMHSPDPDWPCPTYALITKIALVQAGSTAPSAAEALPVPAFHTSSRRRGLWATTRPSGGSQ